MTCASERQANTAWLSLEAFFVDAPALVGFLAITSTSLLSLVMLAATSLVSLVALPKPPLLVGLLVWG